MAELFSLVFFRPTRTIDPMDDNSLSSPAAPAEQSPAPAPHSPISERKLAANRRNAARSTGPRTASGKKRSALNALKHGMLAKRMVIPALEGPRAAAEFRAMLHALISDLVPHGALERILVEEIAVCTWRLRRVLRFENRVAFLNSDQWKDESAEGEDGYECEGDRILAVTGLNEMSLGDHDDVRLITMFEGALMRHLFRTIASLERMQSRRAPQAKSAARNQAPEGSERTQAFSQISEHPQAI
ncbi:MAG: hypothetical protein ACYDC3_13905 [Candidatus Binataceae bacterium]